MGGLLTAYILLRALSFFLRNEPFIATLIAGVLVVIFLWVCVKNLSVAWRVLVLELLLGGAGHFFEWEGLLLRTWVLGMFAVVWVWHRTRRREPLQPLPQPPRAVLVALAAFGAVLVWAAVNGWVRGNAPSYVLQDAMLYLFVLLLFPALEFERQWQSLYTAAVKVFVVGSALFSSVTFALYSSGVFVLTDTYYHWFRNVSAGKITDLGAHFFRIVLPEHLLLLPVIILLMQRFITKPSEKKWWWIMVCALVVVVLNFTRIYFMALGVGALVLLFFYRRQWRRWAVSAGGTLATALFIFFAIHFVASRGESIGFELLGMRSGINGSERDTSSAIRGALLPDIMRTIRERPWLGSGLGTTVTYVDPATNEPQTRTQFDWGYHEMVAELGIVGAAVFILLWLIALYYARNAPWLVASGAMLFVVNITTPALFQGFGVLFFVALVVLSERRASGIFETKIGTVINILSP